MQCFLFDEVFPINNAKSLTALKMNLYRKKIFPNQA
jgi:hypothetical protein